MSSDSLAFQKFYVYGGGKGKSAGFGSHTVAHVELGAGITTEHKKYYVQGELYGIISQVLSRRIIFNFVEQFRIKKFAMGTLASVKRRNIWI